MFKELIQYRNLLWMLTLRDIKIRYKQTVMGFLWAFFMPLLIVCAGLIVKKGFSIVSGKPLELSELISVSIKSLPYSFFIASIRFATNSLVGNANLVTKIYFPREVFPVAAVLANLFDFMLASVFLVVLLAIAGFQADYHALWVPFLMFSLILFTMALGMLLSCANLFFRDVKYIVEVLVTFAIFFTPVFYDASMFGKWAPLLLINPVGAILENINNVVILHRAPDMFWLSYSVFWAVGGLIVSWNVFHRLEFLFAEKI
ncbi:MAG: ABC transporter permease [Deltaproteobacteria bacterium]|nr:ABC transporter permease [Deltaproteobacteria bacterium]